jgi:heme exporter protein B
MRHVLTPHLARSLRLHLRRGPEALVTVFFFVMIAALFALSLGGGQDIVARAAPGIIWTAAALAALLALESLYHRDYDDGTFDLVLMSPVSVFAVVAAKMLCHWLLTGLLLLAALLVVAPMLFIPFAQLGVLILSLFCGTLYLSLLGGFGACLTLGSRKPGILLVLLILPLFLPMLLLGVLAVGASLAGMAAKAYVLLQFALLLPALPLAPYAASVCLTMNVRSS